MSERINYHYQPGIPAQPRRDLNTAHLAFIVFTSATSHVTVTGSKLKYGDRSARISSLTNLRTYDYDCRTVLVIVMEEDVTVADESNCDAILSAAPKIQDLFGVRVERVGRLDGVDGRVLETSDVPGTAPSSSRSSNGPTPPDQQKGCDAVSGVMVYPVADDGVTLDSVNRAKVCTLMNTDCVWVSHAVETSQVTAYR